MEGLLLFSPLLTLLQEPYLNKWCNYWELRGGEGLMPKQNLLISNCTASSGFLCTSSLRASLPPSSIFIQMELEKEMDGDLLLGGCLPPPSVWNPMGPNPAFWAVSHRHPLTRAPALCLPLTASCAPKGCRQLLPGTLLPSPSPQTLHCDYRNDPRQGTIRNCGDKSKQTAYKKNKNKQATSPGS